MNKSTTIKISRDVSVELLLGLKREWLGIGAVSIGGNSMRDGGEPMTVRLQTPEGILYTQYFLDTVERRQDGRTDVHFRAVGIAWGRQEYLDEYEQNMVSVELPKEPVTDHLTLILKPAQLFLGSREWTGLSYAFQFRSRAREIHNLTVRSSWELGGSIIGNTVLSQGQCNMPVYRGQKNSVFTTTCLKTLEQYGSPQGVSYQLAPRGGLIQGFDFQHSKDGALFQYWPRMDAVSSLIESPKGSTHLHVIDDYRFVLSRRATTIEQHVLFTPGKLPEHEARNLWWEAYELVYGGLKQRYKVVHSVVRPEAGCEFYATWPEKGRLRVSILGEEVDSTEMLYLTADKLLPVLAEQGIRRFFPIDAHASDVTELGMKRKLDNGIHGDLLCASVCATHRFFPSEFWGGIKAWRHLAEQARKLGIEIGCWFAPHFSPRAKIFQKHPEWLLRAPNSLHWGGGYGQAIVTADWNSAVYDWVLDDLRRWSEEGGLDYIFTDSLSNMGLVQWNCANSMRTNWERLSCLYGELTKIGIKAFSFEGISPLGVSRFGCADLRGGGGGIAAGIAGICAGGLATSPAQEAATPPGNAAPAQRPATRVASGIVGQNDFGWWVEDLDMAYNLGLHAQLRERSAAEARSYQFQMMANRGAMVGCCHDHEYRLPAWSKKLNYIYEQALPHMKKRRLLPNGAGVRWTNGATQIIWSYQDTSIPIPPGASVVELTGHKEMRESADDKLRAKPEKVYRITR